MNRPFKQYTSEEDAVVRANWASMGAGTSALLDGRSGKSVRDRAVALGLLGRTKIDRWTAADDALLRATFPKEGKRCVKNFPDRSLAAVLSRVTRLGIMREYEQKPAVAKKQKPQAPQSRDGIPMVRSVFELGAMASI